MAGQILLQAWHRDVRAVLHQLRLGPPLKDAQLRNLHITLRPPSPIPTSQLGDHLAAFLETRDGQNLTWNLDFKRRDVILDPEEWPLKFSSPSTSYFIERCI